MAGEVVVDRLHFLAGLGGIIAIGGIGFLLGDRLRLVVVDDFKLLAVLDRLDLGLGRTDLHLDIAVALGQVVVCQCVAVDGGEGGAGRQGDSGGVAQEFRSQFHPGSPSGSRVLLVQGHQVRRREHGAIKPLPIRPDHCTQVYLRGPMPPVGGNKPEFMLNPEARPPGLEARKGRAPPLSRIAACERPVASRHGPRIPLQVQSGLRPSS